jgi:peptidoglycan/xylan/chitin deacetylase (PgdA/CDA1 family)
VLPGNSLISVSAGLAAGTASLLGYHCFAPTSQLYGPTIAFCRDPKDLALTYDDGPNDLHTERLLELLARHQSRATFFLIGRFVAQRPNIARSIVQAGHVIGNHTDSHPNLLFLSSSRLRSQLADCQKRIADVTGIQTPWFRPPFGARRPAVLKIARELGLRPVMWSVTCYDWKKTTADTVERHARKGISKLHERGPILLLHDGGHTGLGADRSHTVEATERLIVRYKDHYRFKTIAEI